MPISLADCLLQPSGDPAKRRRQERESAAPAPPGARDAAPPPARTTAPAEAARAQRPEKELREIRELLSEANREWNGMLEEIHELKEALGPIDFATAFKAYCAQQKAAKPAVAPRPAPPAPVAAPAVAVEKPTAPPAAPAAIEPAKPIAAKPVAAKVATPAAEPSPVAASRQEPPPVAPVARAPQESTEINDKLGELLKLVKEGLGAKPGESPSRVEIPKHLTLEIAREVAGRVKDSVLSSIHHQGIGAAEEQRASGSGAAPAAASPSAAPKRIPLDDIGALIDQLTRQ